MSLRKTLITGVLAASLLAVPAAEAKTVTVKTSGRSVALKKGDRLVVKLDENPSTGYAWATLAKPSFLKQLNSVYTAAPQPTTGPPVVGGGGTRVFTYSALRKGSGTLSLVYRRSFDKAHPGGSFKVKVTVK